MEIAVGFEVGVCVVPGVFGDIDDGVFFEYVKLVRVIEPSIISMVLSTMINMTRLLIVLDSRSLPISPGMLDGRDTHKNSENYTYDAVHSMIAYEYSIFRMKIKNR